MVNENLCFEFAASRQVLTSVARFQPLTALIRQLNLPRTIRNEVRLKKINYGFSEEGHLIPLLLNIAWRRTSVTDLSWLAREEKLLQKMLSFGKFSKERLLRCFLVSIRTNTSPGSSAAEPRFCPKPVLPPNPVRNELKQNLISAPNQGGKFKKWLHNLSEEALLRLVCGLGLNTFRGSSVKRLPPVWNPF